MGRSSWPPGYAASSWDGNRVPVERLAAVEQRGVGGGTRFGHPVERRGDPADGRRVDGFEVERLAGECAPCAEVGGLLGQLID